MAYLPLRFFVGRMTVVGAGWRELAKLVTDHVFGDIHGNVLLAVVDTERQTNELRQNGRTTRPDLDDLDCDRGRDFFGLLQDVSVYEGTFPYGA